MPPVATGLHKSHNKWTLAQSFSNIVKTWKCRLQRMAAEQWLRHTPRRHANDPVHLFGNRHTMEPTLISRKKDSVCIMRRLTSIQLFTLVIFLHLSTHRRVWVAVWSRGWVIGIYWFWMHDLHLPLTIATYLSCVEVDRYGVSVGLILNYSRTPIRRIKYSFTRKSMPIIQILGCGWNSAVVGKVFGKTDYTWPSSFSNSCYFSGWFVPR